MNEGPATLPRLQRSPAHGGRELAERSCAAAIASRRREHANRWDDNLSTPAIHGDELVHVGSLIGSVAKT
eukprot:14810671-Alexandrium_andersonii.AAC.1